MMPILTRRMHTVAEPPQLHTATLLRLCRAMAFLALLPMIMTSSTTSLEQERQLEQHAPRPTPPWIPPPPGDPGLLPFLHDTSRPKLAYSTWVGWYMDGGLNETSLFDQVEAMAMHLRAHGWTHILHDYGWQVCGTTFNLQQGCVRVDTNGRIYPSWERYPSTTATPGRGDGTGSWKPFADRVHAKGLAFGLHLMHGIPKLAVEGRLPILDVSTGQNSSYTADMVVSQPRCQSFIPDNWAINATHPGAQLYYDSVVKKWAGEGIDFIYMDGINGDCGYCHLASAAMMSNSLTRLGNGMHLFISAGPPTQELGCPFDAVSAIAPYVRVGADTVDSWDGAVKNGFSEYTRLTAPSVRPHHFGDLASLMVGAVHCNQRAQATQKIADTRKGVGTGVAALPIGCAQKGAPTTPGPDYEIPSAHSSMTLDEVYSYTSMIAIFRSSWWPSGVLSQMTELQRTLLTNDEVIRVTMASSGARQVIDMVTKSFAGPGIVWTSDDDDASYPKKYVLLVNTGDNMTRSVGAAFEQLGIPFAHACNVSELWNATVMPRASAVLSARLRPHASLFVALSGCGPTEHADN